MSEEILKALMELFALIVKQDAGMLLNEREYVADFLNKQLSKEAVNEYLELFDHHAGPGTIAITIHDSIMTGILTNNVLAVRKILTDELTFFIGFPPQIKMEGIKEENKEKEAIQIISNYYCGLTFVNNN
jgi:hypothetical protein